MRKLTTHEVRSRFLSYFEGRDHQFIQQSSILPKNDPTLLFINSGMAPMKPFFLGITKPPHLQLTNVQNCIRTVDITDVGDSHHGSSFRMMGSWSFGSYFKPEAITLAFNLITEGFGFPADKLYATVFGGDGSLPDVPPDDESAQTWSNLIGESHVVRCGAADNFWGPAGDSGPCGPCTEVFFDRGENYGDSSDPSVLKTGRHIEIWNAGVFMMYNKTHEGDLAPLVTRCVDTGAGLERFAMILQGAASIHEIDQYLPAYQRIYELLQGDTRWTRIVQDHVKTSAMILRCGVVPSNQREGYVLRMLLRRVFSGLYLRGISQASIAAVLDSVWDVMDGDTQAGIDVEQYRDFAHFQISGELQKFGRVLKLADRLLPRYTNAGALNAHDAFEMKTTHGVPEELIIEYCREHAIDFPAAEFNALLEEHRIASRK